MKSWESIIWILCCTLLTSWGHYLGRRSAQKESSSVVPAASTPSNRYQIISREDTVYLFDSSKPAMWGMSAHFPGAWKQIPLPTEFDAAPQLAK